MNTFIFCFKAFIHFLWVLFTPWMKHEYQLRFKKEDDDCWYIDLPEWPFAHANLMMVAGADDLCEELSKGQKHVDVKVVTSNRRVRVSDITLVSKRAWAHLKCGGKYWIYHHDYNQYNVNQFWLCQVTLFVLGWWPKYIYITKI